MSTPAPESSLPAGSPASPAGTTAAAATTASASTSAASNVAASRPTLPPRPAPAGPYVAAEDPALRQLQNWLPGGAISSSAQGPEFQAIDGAPTWGAALSPAILARRGAIMPLPDLGLLRVEGADAASFLQAQLTNDLLTLRPDEWRWTGYCTPKGRLITTALNWRDADGLFLALSRTQAAGLARRLGMYVLRAKAKVSDRSPTTLAFGLIGPAVAVVAQALGFDATPTAKVSVQGACTLIHLDPVAADAFAAGSAPDEGQTLPRAQLWVALEASAAEVPAALPALLAGAGAAGASSASEGSAGALAATGPVLGGTALWHWTEVRSGIARIFPGSSELFVPQMLNFEAVGGVNFKKGCYPGQEIVARSQYLGKLKRRMFLGHLTGSDQPLPAPGEDVHPQAGGEPSGQVVLSAPAPGGGIDVLYESQIAAAEAGVSIGGRAVERRPLPYSLG